MIKILKISEFGKEFLPIFKISMTNSSYAKVEIVFFLET